MVFTPTTLQGVRWRGYLRPFTCGRSSSIVGLDFCKTDTANTDLIHDRNNTRTTQHDDYYYGSTLLREQQLDAIVRQIITTVCIRADCRVLDQLVVASVTNPPIHSFLVNSRNTDGGSLTTSLYKRVGAPHQYPLGIGSKLHLIYAAVLTFR